MIGDVAAFRDPKDNRVLPMLAQFAIREAEQAADNIIARGARRGTRSPSCRTCTASSSASARAGESAGCSASTSSGRPAIVMKRLTYVLYWLQVGSFRLAWSRTRQMLAMHK